ncbi:MAG: ribosome silencing factor [Bacillota bacterium]
MNSRELAQLIAQTADDKKAIDITILELEGISIIADYFVICSGKTDVQVDAIAKAVTNEVGDHPEVELQRKEGSKEAGWLLLDYADVIVHIFRQDERQFYELERLWGDAEEIEWQEV